MSRVTSAEYDRLLKRCEKQAREIEKLKDELAREVRRGFSLDDQLSAVRLELTTERTMAQAAARRREADAYGRGVKNGRV